MADETSLATNTAMRCDAALAENLSARSQSAERWSSTTLPVMSIDDQQPRVLSWLDLDAP